MSFCRCSGSIVLRRKRRGWALHPAIAAHRRQEQSGRKNPQLCLAHYVRSSLCSLRCFVVLTAMLLSFHGAEICPPINFSLRRHSQDQPASWSTWTPSQMGGDSALAGSSPDQTLSVCSRAPRGSACSPVATLASAGGHTPMAQCSSHSVIPEGNARFCMRSEPHRKGDTLYHHHNCS